MGFLYSLISFLVLLLPILSCRDSGQNPGAKTSKYQVSLEVPTASACGPFDDVRMLREGCSYRLSFINENSKVDGSAGNTSVFMFYMSFFRE